MDNLLRIYDNPEFKDRYTVFYLPKVDDMTEYLSLSNDCDSPQGISQSGQCLEAYAGENCGTLITYSSLPDNVQKHISQRLQENISSLI